MIDLQGWRRRNLQRQQWRAIAILGLCYLSVAISYGYYIRQAYFQRQRLAERQSQALDTHKIQLNQATVALITQLHQLVWQQRRQLLRLVNLLSVIPPDIILVGMECQGGVCECDVAASTVQRLTQIFPREELRDLKQGGCPLCYHAKIDVKL